MPPMGFEPTISAGQLQQTYTLHRAATGIGSVITITEQKSELDTVQRQVSTLEDATNYCIEFVSLFFPLFIYNLLTLGYRVWFWFG